VKITRAKKYTLKNVVYDLSRATVVDSGEVIMAHTELVNRGSGNQTMSRQLSFSHEETKTMTTSESLEKSITLEVTVGHTVGKPDVAATTVSSTLGTSITRGFTTSTGTSVTNTTTDSLTANGKVGPNSVSTVLVVGRRFKVNVPYKADLVTLYKDGSTTSKKTTGIHQNIQLAKFTITYSKSYKLCKETTKGTEYRGNINTSVSGKDCQRWDSQSPHKHSRYTMLAADDRKFAANYCRNPDNEPLGPWCYTQDKNKRWEYCTVPTCA